MCAICEQFGVNIHTESPNDGPGDPQSAPKTSFTIPQAAAYLNRSGASWMGNLGQATTLTYAFRDTDASYRNLDKEPGDPLGDPFSKFNSAQIVAATLALQSWADVANLTFNRVGTGTTGNAAYSDNATILFGNAYGAENNDGGAYAYLPYDKDRSNTGDDGDVWVNSSSGVNTNPKLWAYGQQTLVHEIGHALGLSHPGDYNGNAATYDEADFKEDSRMYTVMSYWNESYTGGDFKGDYAAAPLIIDIAAMQRLYGANLSFQTGDTVYGFNSNASRDWYKATTDQTPIFSAWDAGGTDTFDFSGYGVKQTIDLRNGSFSSVGGYTNNVSISIGVKVDGQLVNVIENAIGGSGRDTITGNDFANKLEGRLGDDNLKGLNGNDTLLGGEGNDIVNGGKDADQLVGGDGNDNLNGGKGASKDLLEGGLGADTLKGGDGGDTFVFSAVADSVVGGEDRILDLNKFDTIDLSAIDADGKAGNGDTAFHLGGSSFHGEAGELIRFYKAGEGLTYFQGDTDGDGDADISIIVKGDSHLFGHFVL